MASPSDWDKFNSMGALDQQAFAYSKAFSLGKKAFNAASQGLGSFARGVGQGARNLATISEASRVGDSSRRIARGSAARNKLQPIPGNVVAPAAIGSQEFGGLDGGLYAPPNVVGRTQPLPFNPSPPKPQAPAAPMSLSAPANMPGAFVGPPRPQVITVEPGQPQQIPVAPSPMAPPMAIQKAPVKPTNRLEAMRQVAERVVSNASLAAAQADPLLGTKARTKSFYNSGNDELFDANARQNLGASVGPQSPGVDWNLINSLPGRAETTRSRLTQGGMPYLEGDTPGTAPIQRQTSYRQLADMEPTAANGYITRYQTGDGRTAVLGPNAVAGQDGRVAIIQGDGSIEEVVLPSGGNSLGLRTRPIDGGDAVTMSDTARRRQRNSMTQEGQMNQNLFDAAVDRRQTRRDEALALRRDANALRGQGQVGVMPWVVPGGPMGGPTVWGQPRFGQQGPSLAAAAGAIRERDRLSDSALAAERRAYRDKLGMVKAIGEQQVNVANAEAGNNLAAEKARLDGQLSLLKQEQEGALANGNLLLAKEKENKILEHQNQLAMVNAEQEARLNVLKEQNRYEREMTPGQKAQDELLAKQAEYEMAYTEAAPEVQREVERFIETGKIAPDEVDPSNQDSIVAFAHKILTEPGLSREAKMDILRTKAGIKDKQDLMKAWNNSSYDRMGNWTDRGWGGFLGGNDLRPIEAWDRIMGQN